MAKRSKIEQMPEDVRKWLEKALVKKGFSEYKQFEELLKEKGFDISHAAIHRHGQKLERRLKAVKASTEAARMIAEEAPDDADHLSAATLSLVQTELFEALLNLQEAEEENLDPGKRIKLLSNAARAISQASQASQNQKKWESVQREKLRSLEKAASAGEENIDAATLQKVIKALYSG